METLAGIIGCSTVGFRTEKRPSKKVVLHADSGSWFLRRSGPVPGRPTVGGLTEGVPSFSVAFLLAESVARPSVMVRMPRADQPRTQTRIPICWHEKPRKQSHRHCRTRIGRPRGGPCVGGPQNCPRRLTPQSRLRSNRRPDRGGRSLGCANRSAFASLELARVETQTVPEFRDKNPIYVMCLNRRLQHQSPARRIIEVLEKSARKSRDKDSMAGKNSTSYKLRCSAFTWSAFC